MVFNMSDFHLADLEFFCDSRLDKLNVFSVSLVTRCVDFDRLVTDFCLAMRKFSSIQMIQQTSDDFVRFTFVSHTNCIVFSKCLRTIVNRLELVYNCKINIL